MKTNTARRTMMVKHKRMWMVGSMLTVGAGALIASFQSGAAPVARGAAPAAPAPAPAAALAAADQLSTAFESAADAIGPSVVTIRVAKHVQAQGQMQSPDEMFPRFFFRSPFGGNPFNDDDGAQSPFG